MTIIVILQNTSLTHLTLFEFISKTFIKINASQGTNITSSIINDTSEQSTPLVNQDDSLIPKLGNDKSEQKQTEESGEATLGESSTGKRLK
jgi:hypothetical protein